MCILWIFFIPIFLLIELKNTAIHIQSTTFNRHLNMSVKMHAIRLVDGMIIWMGSNNKKLISCTLNKFHAVNGQSFPKTKFIRTNSFAIIFQHIEW